MKKLALLIFVMVFTTPSISRAEQSRAELNPEIQTGQTLLAKRSKKRRKRRSDRSNGGSKASRAISKKTGVKGILGFLTTSGDNPLVLGADYIMPFDKDMTIDAGVLYWSLSVANIINVSFLTVDGGIGYHIPIGKPSTLEIGARGGIGIATVEYTATNFLTGAQSTESNSETEIILTPFAAFNYNLGGGVIGAEMRIPIILSGDYNMNGNYLLGFYRIAI